MEIKDLLKVLGIKNDATDDEILSFVKGDREEKAKLSAEIDNNKVLISKRNSEIAELKKKHNDSLSEDEKHKQYVAELEKSIAELKTQKTLGDIKQKYLSFGYTNEEADKIADAVINNNYSLVADFQNQHLQSNIEKLKSEMLKKIPAPAGGTPNTIDGKYTKENFLKGLISMEELSKLQVEKPELFDKITK